MNTATLMGGGMGMGLVRQLGNATFPLESLFSGEEGALYDPNVLASMWQDTAGTTPAVVDSPVARIDVVAGTFDPLTQATASLQPILRLNGVTGCHYLDFDATDDAMATVASQAFDTGGIATISCALGVNGAARLALSLNFGGSTQDNAFGLSTANTASVFTPEGFSRGTATATVSTANQLPAPVELVQTLRADVSNDVCELRLNGAIAGSSVVDQGAPAINSRQVFVGRQFSGGLNSKWYGALMIGRDLPADERALMEGEWARRSGAVLA